MAVVCVRVEVEKIVQKAVVLQVVIPWQFFSCAYPAKRKMAHHIEVFSERGKGQKRVKGYSYLLLQLLLFDSFSFPYYAFCVVEVDRGVRIRE